MSFERYQSTSRSAWISKFVLLRTHAMVCVYKKDNLICMAPLNDWISSKLIRTNIILDWTGHLAHIRRQYIYWKCHSVLTNSPPPFLSSSPLPLQNNRTGTCSPRAQFLYHLEIFCIIKTKDDSKGLLLGTPSHHYFTLQSSCPFPSPPSYLTPLFTCVLCNPFNRSHSN